MKKSGDHYMEKYARPQNWIWNLKLFLRILLKLNLIRQLPFSVKSFARVVVSTFIKARNGKKRYLSAVNTLNCVQLQRCNWFKKQDHRVNIFPQFYKTTTCVKSIDFSYHFISNSVLKVILAKTTTAGL